MNTVVKQGSSGVDPFVDAEQIELLGVQHTAVALRPPELGRTYLEDEFDEWAVEQPSSWAAEAEVAARLSLVSAAKTQAKASTAWDLSERQASVVDMTRDDYVKTMRVLAPFVRREAHAKFWYLLRWGVLLGGDVAGITGAAVLLGEIPELAVMQACSAGMATVTAGLVGVDLKDLRLAARRATDPSDLTPELRPWTHLFRGVDPGGTRVKTVALAALAIGLTVGVAIFGLRASVEGGVSGLVFGGLAAAFAAASFVNTWWYADEMADQIDQARTRYETELKRQQQLAGRPELATYQGAAEERDSINREHQLRGDAAKSAITALKHRALRRNPQVVGHGVGKSNEVTR